MPVFNLMEFGNRKWKEIIMTKQFEEKMFTLV